MYNESFTGSCVDQAPGPVLGKKIWPIIEKLNLIIDDYVFK